MLASLEGFSLAELRDVVGCFVGKVRRLHSDRVWTSAEPRFIRVSGAVGLQRGVPLLLPWPGGVQDAAAQQVELGAAIHLPLQQLQAVDVPFGGSVASRVCQRGTVNLAAGRLARCG